MKVIELLNKIANGEDVPNKIIFNNIIWNRIRSKKNVYYTNNYNNLFVYIFKKDLTFTLNDEIEIIEEDKKIEKIDCKDFEFMKKPDKVRFLAKKINEIIDKINKMEDK